MVESGTENNSLGLLGNTVYQAAGSARHRPPGTDLGEYCSFPSLYSGYRPNTLNCRSAPA